MQNYIQDVRSRYEQWWNRENDNPLVYMIFPRDDAALTPAVKDWMSPAIVDGWTPWKHEFVFGQAVELVSQTGDMQYVEDACDLLERYADITDRAGDGYHFLFVNLGASMMSAFLTGQTKFDGRTIWLEHPEPLDWETIESFDESTESQYARVAMASIERLVQRLAGRFVFAPPELGGLLDILAAMRQTMNLLIDTVDEAERLDRVMLRLASTYRAWDRRLSEIIDPANPQCWTQAMRLLSGKPSELATCDFSAMISPEAFNRFNLPFIRHQTELHPGRVYYHLDGPGERPHLDALLALPGMFAVQWVQGAGNPGAMDPAWDDLYRQILDAGKRVLLCGSKFDPDRYREFFSRFPAREFFVPVSVDSRKQAEDALSILWT
jgi:5-methyltetrahydrofolate--homocysteine methyltransferase